MKEFLEAALEGEMTSHMASCIEELENQKEFMKDLKTVYQASSKDIAEHNLLKLEEKWGSDGTRLSEILFTQKF